MYRIANPWQGPCEACHLSECPFNNLKVSYGKRWSVTIGHSVKYITAVIHHHYFYKNEKKVHQYTLKTSTHGLFWIQWHQTAKSMAAKGRCVGCILKLNFSKEKPYLKLWTSETYCRLQVQSFKVIIKDFYFHCSSPLTSKAQLGRRYLSSTSLMKSNPWKLEPLKLLWNDQATKAIFCHDFAQYGIWLTSYTLDWKLYMFKCSVCTSTTITWHL